jgi:hypothetical protein
MTMSNARDILSEMGLDADDAIATDKRLKTKPRRDPRICVCGHAVNKHVIESGACEPTKYKCPCRHLHPVLTAEDTRMFLRKTTGPGPEHALTRGIAALAEAGKGCDWLEGSRVCAKCSAKDVQVKAVPTNSTGTAVLYEHSQFNILVCVDCYKEMN